LIQLPKGTKIAQKMIFVGLAGCLQCQYLFPLMEFAKKNELAHEIIAETKNSKEEYENRIYELMKKLNITADFVPLPIPFLYVEIGEMSRVTQQEILEETVIGIREELNDASEFEYLDNEFANPHQILNYLTKIVTDTVF
jgi:hypothetical protein